MGPAGRYTDDDLQRATKLALELFVKSPEYGQLQANTAATSNSSRLVFSTFFMAIYNWIATGFVSNMRITSKLLGPKDLTKSLLSPYSSADQWSSDGKIINVALRPKTR